MLRLRERASAESEATAAWVGYVTGGVLLIGEVASFVFWPKSNSSAPMRGTSFTPIVGAYGGGASFKRTSRPPQKKPSNSRRIKKSQKLLSALSMGRELARLPGNKETTTMNFVLMIYAAEARFAALSPEQIEVVMQEYGAFTKDLFATGRAGDCAALEPTKTATTVQIRNGQRIVKDGPFAETREQLGGYYSLNAKDEDEVHAWASKIPGAKGGTIEVRPLVESSPAPEGPKVDPKPFKEYILLVYETEARWATMSEAEQAATFERYREFSRGVRASGQLIAGEQLDTVTKAKCVSVKDDGRVVRDGPFAETREQLGGYYRVLAKDLDEAIQIACRIPAVETGTIEVRPITDTSAYD